MVNAEGANGEGSRENAGEEEEDVADECVRWRMMRPVVVVVAAATAAAENDCARKCRDEATVVVPLTVCGWACHVLAVWHTNELPCVLRSSLQCGDQCRLSTAVSSEIECVGSGHGALNAVAAFQM